MSTTDFQEQKNLAASLDFCALRARFVSAEPATSKQCWFLAGLIIRTGDHKLPMGMWWLDSNEVLTKGRASREIETYLAHPNNAK